MKTRIFLALVALLSVSVSVSGQSKKEILYSNHEKHAEGITKEYITLDKKTSLILRKAVYMYDNEGLLQEKTIYSWNSVLGWNCLHKTEYEYNSDKRLSNLAYTEWDDAIGSWSGEAEVIAYVYDNMGNLFTFQE